MIPNVAFIVVFLEYLTISLQHFISIEEDDDFDDDLDHFLITNLIIILELLNQCNELLIFKETFEYWLVRKSHKLIRFVHGYRYRFFS